MSTETFSCGHARTEENTKIKPSGTRRKDGTRRRQARCRTCYNVKRAEYERRHYVPHPRLTVEPTWEVEIRIRRNGKLQRRESALGSNALVALENATNDLARELHDELAVLDAI